MIEALNSGRNVGATVIKEEKADNYGLNTQTTIGSNSERVVNSI